MGIGSPRKIIGDWAATWVVARGDVGGRSWKNLEAVSTRQATDATQAHKSLKIIAQETECLNQQSESFPYAVRTPV